VSSFRVFQVQIWTHLLDKFTFVRKESRLMRSLSCLRVQPHQLLNFYGITLKAETTVCRDVSEEQQRICTVKRFEHCDGNRSNNASLRNGEWRRRTGRQASGSLRAQNKFSHLVHARTYCYVSSLKTSTLTVTFCQLAYQTHSWPVPYQQFDFLDVATDHRVTGRQRKVVRVQTVGAVG
jgi:hypothetical protein